MDRLPEKIQLLRADLEAQIERLDPPLPDDANPNWFWNQPLLHTPGLLIPPRLRSSPPLAPASLAAWFRPASPEPVRPTPSFAGDPSSAPHAARCVSALAAPPIHWARQFPPFHEIWTPSHFSRAALQAITTLPVHVIPLPIEGLERYATLSPAELGLPPDSFLFLSTADFDDPSTIPNPLALCDAFDAAFGSSPSVCLLILAPNPPHDLHLRASASPNIRLIAGPLSGQRYHSLLRAASCFVSPHRGDGSGAGLAAAMYFAKPVIATGYGANTEFMDESNAYLTGYRLAELGPSTTAYDPSAVCAEVDPADLSRQLRHVFDDTAGARAKGAAAARTVRERFDATRITGLIQQRIAQSTPPATPHPAWPHSLLPASVPAGARAAIRAMTQPPRISVITPVFNVDPHWLRRCIDSVRQQWYPHWELCLCDDGSTSTATLDTLESYRALDPRIRIIREPINRGIAPASNRAAELSTGEFLAMLDNDDELTPDALFEVARALQRAPHLDLLYTDEDKIDEHGRYVDHYHKPDWSPEHLQSVMYILHMLVVRKSLFLALGGFREQFSGAQDYDLALRAASHTRHIGHIPKVLYHWRMIQGSAAAQVDAKPLALDAGRRALQDFVRSNRLPAKVEPGLLPGLFRVRYRIPGKPRVTLLLISGAREADLPGRGRVVMVEHFVENLILKTEYRNFEIAVSHDPNITAATAEKLTRLGCRLLPYPKPPGRFNFSHKSNWSLAQVRTEHVVILNDDLEVINGGWLSAMLEYSQQPWIGAVGARLLYADGKLQHAGLALGIRDGAAHVYHQHRGAQVGYNAFTHIVRNYSVVTAAVLATRMSIVEKIGAFDESFAMDYNDVDFCMKLIERGYRVVYTPHAQLYHFEGQVMIRSEQLGREAARFVDKWRPWVDADPHYNVNLSRTRLDFARRGE